MLATAPAPQGSPADDYGRAQVSTGSGSAAAEWYAPGGMKIQVLMSPGCGHGARAVELVAEVAGEIAPGAGVERVEVATLEDAARWAFPGSQTVRIDGIDIDPEAHTSVGLG